MPGAASALIIPSQFTASGNLIEYAVNANRAMKGLAETAEVTSRTMAGLSVSSSGVAVAGGAFYRGIGTGAIAAGYGLYEASKQAVEFQKSMGDVATLVDTTTESMNAMSAAVQQIGKRVPKPMAELTDALYWIRSGGVGAADAMDVLETSGKLATAGLSTTTEAAKAMTSAMVNFKDESLNAAQIADVFFNSVKDGKQKMSDINQSFGNNALIIHQLGIKFKEFMSIETAMTQTGMDASEVMNALALAVTSLNKPTDEMLDVFKMLNVNSGKELINNMGGLESAVNAIADAVDRNPKLLELNKIFGRKGGYTVAVGIQETEKSGALDVVKKQMDAVGTMEEAFGKQAKQAAANIAIFTNNIVILAENMGAKLLPVMQAFLSPIVSLASLVMGAAGSLKYLWVGLGAVWVATKAATAATWLYSKAAAIMESVMWLLSGGLTDAVYGFAMYTASVDAATIATTAFVGILGATGIGLAVAVLGYFVTKLADTDKGLNAVADGLKKDKKGFAELTQPLTDAQLALNKYNSDMAEYIRHRDELAQQKYNEDVDAKKRSAIGNILHDFWSDFGFGPGESGPAPNKADYPSLNNANDSGSQANNFYFRVDQAGVVTQTGPFGTSKFAKPLVPGTGSMRANV